MFAVVVVVEVVVVVVVLVVVVEVLEVLGNSGNVGNSGLQVTKSLSSHFWVATSNIVAPVQRNLRSSTCSLANPGEQ